MIGQYWRRRHLIGLKAPPSEGGPRPAARITMKLKRRQKLALYRYLMIGGFGLILLWVGLIRLSLSSDQVPRKSIRSAHVPLMFDLSAVPSFSERLNKTMDMSVSLITHASVEKVHLLEDIVMRWEGPISCAVYAFEQHPEQLAHVLQNPAIRERVSVHLVVGIDPYLPYPINVMRNVALDYADTDYVFAIDIDFIPSQSCYREILHHLSTKPPTKQVWIVPAFERIISQSEHVTPGALPGTKEKLFDDISSHTIMPFHVAYFAPGHGPTNFEKWYESNSAYQIEWEPRFEPYIVAYRPGLPRYFDAFTGYGYNKLSWIMEISLAGYSFYVLPQSFLTHINHPGRQERWPKKDMQSMYFEKFLPYLREKYPEKEVIDVDWV